jgi:hypothetical protein
MTQVRIREQLIVPAGACEEDENPGCCLDRFVSFDVRS